MLEGDFHPSDVVHSQAHGARASRPQGAAGRAGLSGDIAADPCVKSEQCHETVPPQSEMGRGATLEVLRIVPLSKAAQ